MRAARAAIIVVVLAKRGERMTVRRSVSTLGVVFLAVLGATLVGAVIAVGQNATETESMMSTNDATIREVAPDQNYGTVPCWLRTHPGRL
jgi:predicted PurR-regulated permease PerM